MAPHRRVRAMYARELVALLNSPWGTWALLGALLLGLLLAIGGAMVGGRLVAGRVARAVERALTERYERERRG